MTPGLDQISGTDWVASLVLAAVLGWICVVDLRRFQIPDAASLGLVLIGLGFSPWSPIVTPTFALAGAAIGFCLFAAIGALFFRFTGQDGLGLGDAKLLAAAGAWLGPRDLATLVAVAATSALCFAILARHRKIAFGPWLAAAFWMIWMVRISA